MNVLQNEQVELKIREVAERIATLIGDGRIYANGATGYYSDLQQIAQLGAAAVTPPDSGRRERECLARVKYLAELWLLAERKGCAVPAQVMMREIADTAIAALAASAPVAPPEPAVDGQTIPLGDKSSPTCVHCGDPMGKGDDACWSCYKIALDTADTLAETLNAQPDAAPPSRPRTAADAGGAPPEPEGDRT